MADYDVAVIGGGPGGNAAAIAASGEGASVVLVEAGEVGGMCVHHACIPTNILMNSAKTFVDGKELDVLGVFDVGDRFNFGRAVARKDTLVEQLANGARMGLKAAKVEVLKGRARFLDAHSIEVAGADGREALSATAFVIAAGTEWEKPLIPGVAAERILTADEVQSLTIHPDSAVVLSDGPADTAFGLEYASLLAIAGSDVVLATTRERLLPALDAVLEEVVLSSLGDLGIRTVRGAVVSGEGETISVTGRPGTETIEGGIVVAADVRTPFAESVAPAAAGIISDGAITVDRDCRTNVQNIYAVGDVTGGAMLSSAASHMGEVAGRNATGGSVRTRLAALPQVLHTFPEVAWVGLSEERARDQGISVSTGMFDLSFNARALTLGAKGGVVKVVADATLGEIVGVQAAGPEASEIIAVAAALMQAEVTVHDLADGVHWHPSVAEGLAQAAKIAAR